MCHWHIKQKMPNKLPVSELYRNTAITNKQYKRVSWHNAELYITPFLPIKIFISLIDKIMNDCSSEDGFAIELVDFATRVNIISHYSLVELPDDVESMYYVVYCSDLYDTVIKNINQQQFESIKSTISICLNSMGVSSHDKLE